MILHLSFSFLFPHFQSLSSYFSQSFYFSQLLYFFFFRCVCTVSIWEIVSWTFPFIPCLLLFTLLFTNLSSKLFTFYENKNKNKKIPPFHFLSFLITIRSLPSHRWTVGQSWWFSQPWLITFLIFLLKTVSSNLFSFRRLMLSYFKDLLLIVTYY